MYTSQRKRKCSISKWKSRGVVWNKRSRWASWRNTPLLGYKSEHGSTSTGGTEKITSNFWVGSILIPIHSFPLSSLEESLKPQNLILFRDHEHVALENTIRFEGGASVRLSDLKRIRPIHQDKMYLLMGGRTGVNESYPTIELGQTPFGFRSDCVSFIVSSITTRWLGLGRYLKVSLSSFSPWLPHSLPLCSDHLD